MTDDSVPAEQVQALVALFGQGRFQEAAKDARALIARYPQGHRLHNILGAAEAGLGNIETALAAYRRSIEMKPDYAEAHSNMGATLFRLGRYDEAADCLRRALAIDPDHAQASGNLGAALCALGRYGEAEQVLRNALDVQPENPDLLGNLGAALKELGRIDDAAGILQAAVDAGPGSPMAYSNLAAVLLRQGQLARAEAACREALRLRPDFPDALNNLARVLVMAGRYQDAVGVCRQALSLAPDFSQARINLASALIDLGRYEDAAENCRAVLKIQPENAEAHINLGQAYYVLGRHEDAFAAFEKAVDLAPDNPVALCNYGNVLRDLGRHAEAHQNYSRAIEKHPGSAIAHLGLSRMKSFSRDDPQIAEMERQLQSGRLSNRDKVRMNFALAKAHDDLDRTDAAFARYLEANRLHRATFEYDLADERALFERIKRESLGPVEPAAGGAGRPVPVFVLGMPRSGTTLVEQILASHSQVWGAGELNFLEHAIASVPSAHPTRYPEIGRRYRAALDELAVSEPYVTDKMPLNFRWIHFITAALPDARIIHVRRDPRATCWSIFTQLFGAVGNRYGYDLAELARYYLLYRDLMAFWDRTYPGRIHHLDYEVLTTHQERETQRLIAFLGLDWEEACLDFHLTERRVSTISTGQVRNRMYAGSSDRWRRYERHLAPMLEILDV